MVRMVALATGLTACGLAQSTSSQNMVRYRGQTPTADETQSLDRGRLGTEAPYPAEPLALHGYLVDAGCRDRSALNLKQTPESAAGAGAVETPQESKAENARRSKLGYANGGGAKTEDGALSAFGVTVDPKTLDSERADVLTHQVPDLRARQADPTCAITGETRGFALLMKNGRLLDLDEGGNTMATEAIQSSDAGRRMLNGYGPGVKPKAAVKARVHGDRAVVTDLRLE